MKIFCLAVVLFSLSVCAMAQQDYVGRYDFYAGFSYLYSPKLNLQQRGENTQIGVNLRRWLAFGVDYSIQFGGAALTPSDLKTQYATPLNELLEEGQAGLLAPVGFPASYFTNYRLYAPFDATTQTFAIGPQLTYRHFKRATFFIHPSLGVIHENITLHSHDAFTQELVLPALLGELPGTTAVLHTTKPNDTTPFYGLGGGADYNLTKHFHVRTDLEFVHTYLFSNLLATARNSLRVSFGPTINFGRNVTK
jgi:hypothetical protein